LRKKGGELKKSGDRRKRYVTFMAKFVLILYVPGIPALSMSDIDFDFGGVWPKEIIKSNRDYLCIST
jgi:hypothetical protein